MSSSFITVSYQFIELKLESKNSTDRQSEKVIARCVHEGNQGLPTCSYRHSCRSQQSHSWPATSMNSSFVLLHRWDKIPESTGWMLFRRIVAPRRYPSLDVSLINSGTSVNSSASCFRKMRTTAVKKIPIKTDVATAMTTENFAAFGWFAPSSFDTRTPMNEHRKKQEILAHVGRCCRCLNKMGRCLPHCGIETQSNHQSPCFIVHAARSNKQLSLRVRFFLLINKKKEELLTR